MLDPCTYSQDGHQLQLRVWEAQAKALFDQPSVWAMVKSVAEWLWEAGGDLEAEEIGAAIKEWRFYLPPVTTPNLGSQ
jgi:hypothetical protein